MVRNEGEKLRSVIVAAPGREYFKVENPEAHNIAEVADPRLATSQHRALRAALKASGAQVINLRELAGHPNSVFVRDAGLVTPRGYVKLRMGLSTRRGEEGWAAAALDSLGLPCVGAIEEPGTVEGGDVILAGTVAFIGQSGRTNKSGVRQLSRFLAALGYEVRSIALPPPHLHLGGLMSAVGPRSVLSCGGTFPGSFFAGFEVVEISCRDVTGANVIALGGGEIVAEKSSLEAARALEASGFTIRKIDLSEFVKGRGGPTCLILPVERSDRPSKRKLSNSRPSQIVERKQGGIKRRGKK